jgi:hypothetical protein
MIIVRKKGKQKGRFPDSNQSHPIEPSMSQRKKGKKVTRALPGLEPGPPLRSGERF